MHLLIIIAICALVLVGLVMFHKKPPRPPIVFLQGSSLDFVPSGSSAIELFQGEHNLLIGAQTSFHVEDVNESTIEAACLRLYNDAHARIFVGMLESALLLRLAPFARDHPECIFVSASSSVPRAQIFPSNVFRLYASDANIAGEVHQAVSHHFFENDGDPLTRVVLHNGSPENAWATTVAFLLQQMESSEHGGYDVVLRENWTPGEEAGIPRSDTVYIYAGAQNAFDFASHFAPSDDSEPPANILVVSGTGWVLNERESPHVHNHNVRTFDMVNDPKMLLAAQLRVKNRLPWPGYLLQALFVASEVEAHTRSGEAYRDTCMRIFGPQSYRFFTSNGDGDPTGSLVNRFVSDTDEASVGTLRPASTLQGEICSTQEDDAWAAQTNRFAVVNMSVGTVKPITCADQTVACANALDSGVISLIYTACAPTIQTIDQQGSTCLDVTQGGACMLELKDCIESNTEFNAARACAQASQICTPTMLYSSIRSGYHNAILSCGE